jgi:TonB family protein
MNNAIAYGLQVLLVIAAGALLPRVFRIHLPKARLWFWQGLLAVCLLLPFVQPRRMANINFTIDQGPMQAGTPVAMVPAKQLPVAGTLLGIYAAGVALRGIWLLMGLLRLRRYRQNATELYPAPSALAAAQERLATFPDIRISSDIASPVTFGLSNPVILLPPGFLDLNERSQEAIAVHELMHVRRGDWIFSISEEIVRSVLWIHPAIWWLLAQIQLTREQVVDRATVEFTSSREHYLEALLAVARTKVRPDLALAPLFLRKRHLARRVAAVMKEVRMSKRQMISSLAIVFTLALVMAGVAVFMFPLESSAQEAGGYQSPGISVDTYGHKLLHGSRIEYPQSAREKRIEGTVVLQLSLNAQGQVSDARVISGPDELRNAALSSALQWHLANESGQPATSQASITFKAPPSPAGFALSADQPKSLHPSVLRKIEFVNVPDNLREALQRRLSVRVGDTLAPGFGERLAAEIRAVDEHLEFGYRAGPDGSGALFISLKNAGEAIRLPETPFNPPPTPGVKRIRVGGNAQSQKLIEKSGPSYPALAKQARIQGTVRYNALIGKDGTMQAMDLVAGHPLLVEAATPAVRQWKYQTTLLNGEPVEVVTVIDVNFTLTQ